MKILYHHRTLGDGAEGIHITAMVEAFRSLGHDVKVAAVIGEQTNVQTSRTHVLTPITRWMPRAVYEAMELGYSLPGYFMLKKHIESWKPDVLYERYILFNHAGLLAARKSGIPLILEVNAPLAYERARYERLSLYGLAYRCERFICSQANLTVVVSTPLKDYLIERGVPPEHIVVIPNGVEPSTFTCNDRGYHDIRSQLGISDDAVVIGFAGILRSWHGVEMLFEAVAQLRIKEKRVHVLIVGDGPSRFDLEQFARSRGLQDIVTFTGRVPHADMPRYINAFDIGVSPRTTFYASPMKVLEYMAAGIAVLAPHMPNLQDLIVDGINGRLFQPESIDALSASLHDLVCDPTLRQRLGMQARATILAERTWQHNAKRILDLVGKESTWS